MELSLLSHHLSFLLDFKALNLIHRCDVFQRLHDGIIWFAANQRCNTNFMHHHVLRWLCFDRLQRNAPTVHAHAHIVIEILRLLLLRLGFLEQCSCLSQETMIPTGLATNILYWTLSWLVQHLRLVAFLLSKATNTLIDPFEGAALAAESRAQLWVAVLLLLTCILLMLLNRYLLLIQIKLANGEGELGGRPVHAVLHHCRLAGGS